jgi:predicted regulator of Ras-like GTPase activity (Roadblock/LC7/MglB family)
MLKELLALPDVRHAVLLTADGLLHSKTEDLGQDYAELLSAAVSGLAALAKDIGSRFYGSTHAELTMLQFESGYLVARQAAEGTSLAVVTGPSPDMELLSGGMDGLVDALGAHLTSERRHSGDGPA